MSHTDYGFYFFEEKKKIICESLFVYSFFFFFLINFYYCLLVGFQQPSEKVNKICPKYLTLRAALPLLRNTSPPRGAGSPRLPPAKITIHRPPPACCLPAHTHSRVSPSLVLSPSVLCVFLRLELPFVLIKAFFFPFLFFFFLFFGL